MKTNQKILRRGWWKIGGKVTWTLALFLLSSCNSCGSVLISGLSISHQSLSRILAVLAF